MGLSPQVSFPSVGFRWKATGNGNKPFCDWSSSVADKIDASGRPALMSAWGRPQRGKDEQVADYGVSDDRGASFTATLFRPGGALLPPSFSQMRKPTSQQAWEDEG